MIDKKENIFIYEPGFTLRPLRPEDLKWRVQWLNDPDIRKTLVIRETIELEKTKQWFEDIRLDPCRLDLFIETKDARPIGVTGFRKISIKDKSACIYIVIGEKQWWGKGLMYDVHLCLMRFGFTQLGFNKIWGDVLEDNIASLITLKKIGFHREGILREDHYSNGHFQNIYRLSMLAEEFKQTYPDSGGAA